MVKAALASDRPKWCQWRRQIVPNSGHTDESARRSATIVALAAVARDEVARQRRLLLGTRALVRAQENSNRYCCYENWILNPARLPIPPRPRYDCRSLSPRETPIQQSSTLPAANDLLGQHSKIKQLFTLSPQTAAG